MVSNKGAALIYTKTHTCGFRQSFVVQPKDFSETSANKYMKYVQASLSQIEELRNEHAQRQIVIADDAYVILAEVGFLRDYSDVPRSDGGNRPIQSFTGVAFKRDEFSNCTFPDNAFFRGILEEYIYPHWTESPNSVWANTLQLSDYSKEIETAPAQNDQPASSTRVSSKAENAKAVADAILMVSKGENITLCTNQNDLNRRRAEFNRYSLLHSEETQPPEQTEEKSAQIQPVYTTAAPAANRPVQIRPQRAKVNPGIMLLVAAAMLLIMLILGICLIRSLVVKVILGVILAAVIIVCAMIAVKETRSKKQFSGPVNIRTDVFDVKPVDISKHENGSKPVKPIKEDIYKL